MRHEGAREKREKTTCCRLSGHAERQVSLQGSRSTHKPQAQRSTYLFFSEQVYYAPRLPFDRECTLPTIFGAFALLRNIVIREQIHLLHAHQVSTTHQDTTLTLHSAPISVRAHVRRTRARESMQNSALYG
jgi:hypothetical protein